MQRSVYNIGMGDILQCKNENDLLPYIQQSRYSNEIRLYSDMIKVDKIQDCQELRLLHQFFSKQKQIQRLFIEISFLRTTAETCCKAFGNILKDLDQLLNLELIIGQSSCIGYNKGLNYIGDGLRKMINLQCLHLTINSFNYITLIDQVGLGYIIRDFTQLTQFKLIIGTSNHTSQEFFLEFWRGLKEIKSLKLLSIKIGQFNKVGTLVCQGLIRAISNLTNLEELNLNICGVNDMNEYSLQGLDSALKQLIRLESLTLIFGQQCIQQNGVKAIGSSLKYLPQLKHFCIYIGENSITLDGSRQLLLGISHLSNLTSFSFILTSRNLQPENASIIGTHFKDALLCMPNLLQLSFFFDHDSVLSSLGAQSIGEGLAFLENLTHLSFEINQCEIKDEGIEGLCKGFSKMNKLKQLHLNIVDNNNLSKNSACVIGDSIKQLRDLQQFYIVLGNWKSSSIEVQGVNAILQGIQCLINLTSLGISIRGRLDFNQYLLSIRSLPKLRLLSTLHSNYNKEIRTFKSLVSFYLIPDYLPLSYNFSKTYFNTDFDLS